MQKNDNQVKYLRLMEHLKQEILLGKIKPGEQIPSENVLAETMSLSRHTVRKAISMLVNEGYLYTEHGRGTYCLDRSRKRSDSRNIAVITTYISEYIFPKVIQGIDSVLSSNGYSIMLKNTNNNTKHEAVCLEDVLQKNVEGLIIEPTKSALYSENMKFYEALDNHRIPYIFIHGFYQQLDSKSHVLLDDAKGMYSAVEYLARLGHKKIAGIFKADDVQGVERHNGYAKAIADAGMAYNPDDVIWFHTEDRDIKPYNMVKRLMEEKRGVDAIACYNDEIAFRVYELLNSLGVKVPDDVSITGFDDSYFSANCPVKITTVRHPKEKLGEEAAEILLQMIKQNDYLTEPVQKTIVPELIIKDSCIKR
ncbi:transcriptional regulator, GntR family with LacI sensor [Ruminiclostridium papyrosolvens DSM 2782]|uniref:Transcriptional regulator, GntR family with LacI sensor n=1 Tax=Ruminiclostridium papyrosolvens DSM 2782 TaxID=588581 RepID=F1TFG6_9FIRM|nr:GntR family transcriptional regulator [Ruminiclostridium papyrosolvens]EGD46890.1 transcriptional regulator, GntR family with LacI sensor [Ruminiclostridium papyrosolvens DSM 2782]WES34372.1 GntR family transcriptional regulator [Ruminiclostridium papyrosolvens DSM 2782]